MAQGRDDNRTFETASFYFAANKYTGLLPIFVK
jgi:hypothetical protein